jgi:thioredoxin reductase
VTDPSAFAGRRVVIIGGGDSAFDWAHQLRNLAASVALVHRSDRFRAHAATVAQVEAAAARGDTAIHTFHELHQVIAEDGRIVALDLKDLKAKSIRRIDADVVLPLLGFVSDIGPLAEWGVTVEKDEIIVNSQMETGRPGVWAAGDITAYPGKLKLIATGFAEAATAVNQAVHHLYPEKKVNPGHSSNLAIFGQKDD